VLPILEAGLAEVIPGDHAIAPGLASVSTPGHTLGHTALHLISQGHEAWFTGDTFHHPLELLHPELDAGTCEDYAQTLATRRKLIDTFVASGALIVPAHFAAPHAGYLREEGGIRHFVPLGS
jgi:glyoxylase-like metal-dependent hydrolase (beta-lactamase superfamily II)